MEAYYSWLFYTVLFGLALGVLLALVRAIRGPRIADRIVGINMVGTMSLAMLAVISVLQQQPWLLDVSLIYCMISFLAVVVLAQIHIAANRKEDSRE